MQSAVRSGRWAVKSGREQRMELHVSEDYRELIEAAGLTGESVFTDPRIVPWRKLPDRENCTLDLTAPDGTPVRLHVKRYTSTGGSNPAQAEARGHALLHAANIPTAPLPMWGVLPDGRSFAIFEDLTGYAPADKLIESGTTFDTMLEPTADLAAALHNAQLHHRDLYLCHFMARTDVSQTPRNAPVKLIDTARVSRMANPLTRRRWIVKDLAQFWYSTTKLPISDVQRERWFAKYVEARRLTKRDAQALLSSLRAKSSRIAHHDANLNRKQPTRNVSIPR